MESALISICHWCRRTQSGPKHDFDKFKTGIGIGIKVKVCADLDSDGLALLNNDDSLGRFSFDFRKCFDIGWGIRQICLLVKNIGFSACWGGEDKSKYKHRHKYKYKYKSAVLVRRKLTTCWSCCLKRGFAETSRDYVAETSRDYKQRLAERFFFFRD